MSDLLTLVDAPHMTPEQRRKISRSRAKPKGLYAAQPGTGPQGETCGSCWHLFHNRMAKTYLKCALVRGKWTGGGGTDVKSRSLACAKWAAK